MALILEVLDPRTGAVRARQRLDRLPLSIGRGLTNDIVLDDPYADPAHARLEADDEGGVVLTDLDSVNRLLLPSGERTGRVMARPGAEVRIGRTPLRVRDAAAPMAPALQDTSPFDHARLRWLTGTGGRIGVIAACAAGFWLYTWLNSYERSSASDAFAAALGIAILAAFWAGIWAVAGRIVVHRFQFFGHMALASLAAAATLLIGEMTAWGEFLFPDHFLWPALGILAAIALVAALLAWHLRLASGMPPRRRWTASFVATGIIFGLGGAATLIDDEPFSDVPEFSGVLKPAAWTPTITPAQFRTVTGGLREEVDALRLELDARTPPGAPGDSID